MIIPKNVTDLKARMKATFAKPVDTNEPIEGKVEGVTRRTASQIHKEREKRRALTDELKNAQTSEARKQEIIEGLQAQLDLTTSELEEHKSKLEDLTPKAKKWSDFEHKERTKLLEQFPVEERKEAKSVAESMPLETFRTYANKLTGKSISVGTDAKTGAKDWETIINSPDADAQISADPNGFNSFMETRGK